MQNRDEGAQPQQKSSSSKMTTGIISAGIAGGLEAVFFTHVDTAVARIQTAKISRNGQSFSQLKTLYNAAIFQQAYHQNGFRKLLSLYNGFPFAFAYRSIRAMYKFGGQNAAIQYLNPTLGKMLKENLGEKAGQTIFEATVGGAIAMGDVMFLPLDNMKTKYQTNKEYFKKRGAWQVMTTEGPHLFNGTCIASIRNISGSTAMFGTSMFVKQYIFGLDDASKATKGQIIGASAAAGVMTILVTNPTDVLKTRFQQLTRDQVEKEKVSGFSIFKKLIKEEGFGALMKGFTLRVVTAAPRLMFTMALTQILTQSFQKPEESHAPRLK